MEAEDAQEAGLMLVQKLHSEGLVNDDQRDVLKDMILDEDAILMSFFNNYGQSEQGEEDEEELTQNVINYVNKGNFQSAQNDDEKKEEPKEEKKDDGEETYETLEDCYSPQDSAINTKK